jgi:hypothetical protein
MLLHERRRTTNSGYSLSRSVKKIIGHLEGEDKGDRVNVRSQAGGR